MGLGALQYEDSMFALFKQLAAFGGVVALIAGTLTSLSIIFKQPLIRKPVAFVYHHLFAEPVGAWTRKQVATVVRDVLMQPNGGSSNKDISEAIKKLTTNVEQLSATVQEDREAMRTIWREIHEVTGEHPITTE